MNTAEKIAAITRLANSWMGMDRYASLRIDHYPTKAVDGFTEGERVYDAEIDGSSYAGYEKIRGTARTVDEALDLLFVGVKKALDAKAQYRREKLAELTAELEYAERQVREVEAVLSERDGGT